MKGKKMLKRQETVRFEVETLEGKINILNKKFKEVQKLMNNIQKVRLSLENMEASLNKIYTEKNLKELKSEVRSKLGFILRHIDEVKDKIKDFKLCKNIL